jgi:hypothetical protein
MRGEQSGQPVSFPLGRWLDAVVCRSSAATAKSTVAVLSKRACSCTRVCNCRSFIRITMLCIMFDSSYPLGLIPRWNHSPRFRLITHWITLPVSFTCKERLDRWRLLGRSDWASGDFHVEHALGGGRQYSAVSLPRAATGCVRLPYTVEIPTAKARAIASSPYLGLWAAISTPVAGAAAVTCIAWQSPQLQSLRLH